MPGNIDPPQPDNRMGYGILHALWVIGLTLATVIGLCYAYVYFITYGAMTWSSGLDRSGQSSKISNNFEGIYYQGVLGQLRLARQEPPGRDSITGRDP